ncbi:uncharacterized protein [Leptinotarsa decemlineata]|uniref:uncharacterized protein n=1 Tax=Leptinotarsa decemlineata TaxID=7539 RepID=UPI003D30D578
MLKSENDSEVEGILTAGLEKSPSTNDKPLSPILISSNLNRKFLLGKRATHKKVRRKLTDKFEDSLSNPTSNREKSDPLLQEFSEESFTLSQSEDLISCLNRLEEIEKNRDQVYKLIVNNSKEFCFKKPISPAPNKIKRIKSHVVSSINENQSDLIENESMFNVTQIPNDKTKCSGFQTATGKQLYVPEHVIKKHEKLFEDILIPSQQADDTRKNKYNFLSKATSNVSIKNDCEQSMFKNNMKHFGISSKTDFELETDSLHQNISDVEEAFSFTQQICDSEISNSQMISAVDNVLGEINSSNGNLEFRGFSSKEILESSTIHQQILHIHKDKINKMGKSNSESVFKVSGKHKIYFTDSPPKKRLKHEMISKVVAEQQNLGVKDNVLSSYISSGGFVSASGKSLVVSSGSLKRAKHIFDQVESEMINDKTLISHEGSAYLKDSIADQSISKKDECHSDSLGVKKNLPSGSLNLPPEKRVKQEMVPEVTSKQQNPKMTEIMSSFPANFSCNNSGGFSSASGKSLVASSQSLKKAKRFFDQIELEVISDKSLKSCHENDCFKSSITDQYNNVHTEVKENLPNNIEFRVSAEENTVSENGDKLKIALNTLSNTKSKALYSVKDKLKFFDKMLENDDINFIPTSSASENKFKMSGRFMKGSQSDFTAIDNGSSRNNIQEVEFPKITAQTDAKNKLKLLDEAIKMAETKYGTRAEDSNYSPLSFSRNAVDFAGGSSSVSRNTVRASGSVVQASNMNFEKTKANNTPVRSNLNMNNSFGSNRQVNKRKLGVASCKQIPISETKLNRAKKLFHEEFLDVSPIKPEQQYNVQVSTPLRPKIQNIIQTSTPLRNSFCSTPVKNSNLGSIGFNTVSENSVVEATEEKSDGLFLDDKLLVTFDETNRGCCSDIEDDLEAERKRLERRLKIITERKEAVLRSKERKPDDYRKPRPGVLYLAKRKQNKVPLTSFVDGRKPGETCNYDLSCISPQNAEKINFKESASILNTEDGATVIPNSKNFIGLSEIEYAFRTMPGVEERLIPKGWIRNHYKWVVWKLASYERMFPLQFNHSLGVEHVIQQLKYRYDREIDKAERPALRKIFEKDDAPQKRMVVCVSDIKQVDSNKFELELTDGWYGIRTVVDDPLCYQILKKKIQIGTKLITCGAELMNCDGCSPLEATDLTYLKINFNCTRRSIWSTRLGYQRFPGPFPIPINSVHPLGGTIGAIQISIARVYPVKYLEKLGCQSVWRNKKAEERRAQEWEMERCRKMDEIESGLMKELYNDFNQVSSSSKKENAVASLDLGKINCPEVLLNILENSNDPESLQEKLSSTQKTAIMEYKRNLFQQKQQEISSRMKQNAEKLKVATRDVVPLFKMLVVDINGSPTRAFSFTIWRPSESHFQILREGTSMIAYNVLPKMNGDLSSSSKTMFKPESPREPMSEIFKRKVIEITELSASKFSVNFSEFDTVGLVVQIKIDVKYQEAWLADFSGRLLLIQIYEGPTTCLLLDNVKRGQAVTVCNLRFRNLTDDVSQAIGNHFTVFSSYSQHKHLQEYLEDFKKTMPKGCDELLEDCDNKIEKFRCKSKLPSGNLDESDEDTLISSRITSTDLALSLMDIDKLI